MALTYVHFLDVLKIHGVLEPCLKKFKSLKHNSEKVNFVEKLVIKYDFLKAENSTQAKLRIEKNNTKSGEYRAKGNELFFEKKYSGAMDLYNKSISFAEAVSENLSIGFANRSAVLFKSKMYKESLENIKLAKNAKYPERLIHKLDKREADCQRLLNTQENSNAESFDFTFNPNPVIPQVADGIDIKCVGEKSKSIYTKRALKVGECISIEEPFCTVLRPEFKYARCANCNLESFSLIPCPNCTGAMFCSEKCMTGADRFHKFECPIIDLLHSVFKDCHLIALRNNLIGLSLFENVNEWKTFFDAPQNQNQNLFTLNHENLSEKEYFRAICGYVAKESSIESVLLRITDVAVLRYYLLRNTPLKEIFSGDQEKKFFTEILTRNFMVSPGNTIRIFYVKGGVQVYFTSGVTSFTNLINHSCAPNISLNFRGTKIYALVKRPIPADGEIFSSYRSTFSDKSKLDRQMDLFENYFFNCKCEACEGNYPMRDELCVSPYVPLLNLDLPHFAMTYSYAEKNFPIYCAFLEKYQNYYPCLQIDLIEKRLLDCLLILFPNFSLRAKLKNKKNV